MKSVKKIWHKKTVDTFKWTLGPGQRSFCCPLTPMNTRVCACVLSVCSVRRPQSIFSSNFQCSLGSSPKSPPHWRPNSASTCFLAQEEDLAGNLITTLNPFELPVCSTYTDHKASVCPTTGRSVQNIHTAAQDFIVKHFKRCSGSK